MSIEARYEMWDDKAGMKIEVGPDRDGLDLITISTQGESAAFFGPASLMLTANQAEDLAKAILRAVADRLRAEADKRLMEQEAIAKERP